MASFLAFVAVALVSIITLTILDGLTSNLDASPATKQSIAKYDYDIEPKCLEKPIHLTGCVLLDSKEEKCDKVTIKYIRSCVQKTEVQK